MSPHFASTPFCYEHFLRNPDTEALSPWFVERPLNFSDSDSTMRRKRHPHLCRIADSANDKSRGCPKQLDDVRAPRAAYPVCERLRGCLFSSRRLANHTDKPYTLNRFPAFETAQSIGRIRQERPYALPTDKDTRNSLSTQSLMAKQT